jgi:hypothetical protein
MENIAKRPRGRPSTNKNIITKPAAQPESTTRPRGRPATYKDIVKAKTAIIVKQPKEIKAKQSKLNKSKPLDIPLIKEMSRDDEKK